ncbi:MAG: peptidylprolyl isomerase, partial [Planctomycetota bacterium]
TCRSTRWSSRRRAVSPEARLEEEAMAEENRPRVALETTLGRIVLELDPERAPQTVANFLRYVDEGFYDGTVFHRVVRDFVIQGGGHTEDLERKPTHAPIPNEARNGLRNVLGTISMARTADPDSATSQFFISVKDNSSSLDPGGVDAHGYAVFGQVVDGMDTVNEIRGVAVTTRAGHRSVPVDAVVVTRAGRLP